MNVIKNVAVVAMIVVLGGLGGIVHALEVSTGVTVDVSTKGKDRGMASGTVNARVSAKAASSTTDSKATTTGQEHRSEVAAYVQGLLRIADRDAGGIGSQVRVIAREQNDSGTTTAQARAQIETRGKFKTFLIGSDYKNIGIIRSELAQTEKRIARLEALAVSSTVAADKDELNLQIQALKDDKVKLELFVEARENVFSLFGWFVKLFN